MLLASDDDAWGDDAYTGVRRDTTRAPKGPRVEGGTAENLRVTPDGHYAIADAPWALRPMINRRRSVISPIPGLDVEQSFAAKRDFFSRVGLDDYIDSAVVEMGSRPIVEVSEPGTYAAVTDMFRRWAPMLYEWMFTHSRSEQVTYNTVSRVGAPYCSRLPSKRDELWPQFRDLSVSSPAAIAAAGDGLYTMTNVRLQPEKRGRVRTMTFVHDDSTVTRERIGAEERRVAWRDLVFEALRTRDIFMPNFMNNATQPVDSMLHSPWLRTILCGHDMFAYQQDVLPRGAEAYLHQDVRHVDRHTGECLPIHAAYVGGRYEQMLMMMLTQPYLVPTSSWGSNKWVWPLVVAQLASGVSPVALMQKLVFIATYLTFLVEYMGMTEEHAFQFLINGGDGSFAVRNYGDDNALAGRKKNLDSWFSFCSEAFDVEIEDPPKFLGFIWDETRQQYYLSSKSYALKTWLNERAPASMWRPNANYGWKMRREAYMRYGHQAEMLAMYRAEDEVLEKYGLPWTLIEERAAEEAAQLKQSEEFTYDILGKTYLLTPAQRARLPGYEALPLDETREFITNMVDPQWRSKLFTDVGDERLRKQMAA